jgi:hypothetical protein
MLTESDNISNIYLSNKYRDIISKKSCKGIINVYVLHYDVFSILFRNKTLHYCAGNFEVLSELSNVDKLLPESLMINNKYFDRSEYSRSKCYSYYYVLGSRKIGTREIPITEKYLDSMSSIEKTIILTSRELCQYNKHSGYIPCGSEDSRNIDPIKICGTPYYRESHILGSFVVIILLTNKKYNY